ncbi:4Fe-4S dicluster domain-containing protein [Eubacteriales bacterium OttesenSCG-928-A19]|nr:4Fe-4S dicluster domain-containing protein [Eubacteriales bacterium OttesenSCG-928-A19]
MNTIYKKYSKKVLWIIIILLAGGCIGQSASAIEAPMFPKTYEISDADVLRYEEILRSALDSAPPSMAILHSSVEEKAALWEEYEKTLSEDYDGDAYGLPSGDALTEEQAIFLAYAAVEDKYGFDEDVLYLFYPDLTYEISNVDVPIWRVALVAYNAVAALNEKIKVPCTGCGYCMPCPKGVDIPSCFACYNDSYTNGYYAAVSRYGQVTGGYTANPSDAALCVKCGMCESKCPQQIKVSSELTKVRRRLLSPLAKPLYRMVSKAIAKQ